METVTQHDPNLVWSDLYGWYYPPFYTAPYVTYEHSCPRCEESIHIDNLITNTIIGILSLVVKLLRRL